MHIQFVGAVLAPIIQAASSLAVVVGLFLVRHQIRVTNDWCRANTQHALLSSVPALELEGQLRDLLERYETDEHWRLHPDAWRSTDPSTTACAATTGLAAR